jgi:hypothetical protein
MSDNERLGNHRLSSYAFSQDAGPTPWINLRWVRDIIAQFEVRGRSLRDIGGEDKQIAAVRQAAQAADEAHQRGRSR